MSNREDDGGVAGSVGDTSGGGSETWGFVVENRWVGNTNDNGSIVSGSGDLSGCSGRREEVLCLEGRFSNSSAGFSRINTSRNNVSR